MFGSSPLSRGIHGSAVAGEINSRIIPALAGNTQSFFVLIPSHKDHPRSRGEYAVMEFEALVCAGSSPLSRGIHPRTKVPRSMTGIIPALAGNTFPIRSTIHFITDHPRSRGEYRQMAYVPNHKAGSSPLSRGILEGFSHRAHIRGIIPALAGNTASSPRRSRMASDHPRSRGEYRLGCVGWQLRQGSSPLSRGILITFLWFDFRNRIIPALAGNTMALISIGATPTDHPRSRGEYFVDQTINKLVKGSSPLSRGIHDRPRESSRG